MERKQKQILGYGVDLFSFKDALAFIKGKMDNSVGAQVVTINPEMIELADRCPEFAEALHSADLVIPDGFGIKLALKIKGVNQEQIPGIEFSKKLIEICADNNYPIALIGAQEKVIQKACENLKNEFGNLNIAFVHNGFFDSEQENKMIEELEKIQPKLVLVALGAPKQEVLIKKFKKTLDKSIFVGVGGSFDVWSGEVQRAPIFFRKIGCEWLYRVLKQPERFKRIFPTLPLFLIKVVFSSK